MVQVAPPAQAALLIAKARVIAATAQNPTAPRGTPALHTAQSDDASHVTTLSLSAASKKRLRVMASPQWQPQRPWCISDPDSARGFVQPAADAAAADAPFADLLSSSLQFAVSVSAPQAPPVLRNTLLVTGVAHDLHHWAAAMRALCSSAAMQRCMDGGKPAAADTADAIRLTVRPPPPPWPRPLGPSAANLKRRRLQAHLPPCNEQAKQLLADSASGTGAAALRVLQAAHEAQSDWRLRPGAPHVTAMLPAPHATPPLQYVLGDAASFCSQLALLQPAGRSAVEAALKKSASRQIGGAVRSVQKDEAAAPGALQHLAMQLQCAALPVSACCALLDLAQTRDDVLSILCSATRSVQPPAALSAATGLQALEWLAHQRLHPQVQRHAASQLLLLADVEGALTLVLGGADAARASLTAAQVRSRAPDIHGQCMCMCMCMRMCRAAGQIEVRCSHVHHVQHTQNMHALSFQWQSAPEWSVVQVTLVSLYALLSYDGAGSSR